MLIEIPPHIQARISLNALRRNLRKLRGLLPDGTAFSAVVKSDAYGHGLECVAPTIVEEGCRFLIVSSLHEALRVRERGIDTDVLVIGPLLPEGASEVVARGFAVSLGGMEMARALDREARRQNSRARVHLKIDTGMGRFGFFDSPDNLNLRIDQLLQYPGLDIEGAMTHFSEADDPDSDYTLEQARRFRLALDGLRAKGIAPKWVHAANSGAVEHFPEMSFSMARLGISMYGSNSVAAPDPKLGLEPVMTVATRIAGLRHVPEGTPVSYGRTHVTTRPTRLALLPIGYGDGFPRHASGRAEVMVRGTRLPVLGRVTMNLTVVDATDIEEIHLRDPVLVFGREGEDILRVEELAQASDTIPYEILCIMGRSAPRIVSDD